MKIPCYTHYTPARQGNVITVESAVVLALSVMLCPDISITGILAVDCVTVSLVSMLDTGVDSFCFVVED